MIDTIPVKGSAQSVAYDYANGDMYIAIRNFGPSNEVNGIVDIIDSQNKEVGSITVGVNPYVMAYDTANKNGTLQISNPILYR